MSLKVSAFTDMIERQPNRPPIPEPKNTSHEGGNGSPGLPRTVHESAKPPPEGAVNKPPLTPEQRAEKKRDYMRNYRKNNKDKVNEAQRRYYHEGSKRTNQKLIDHQWRLREQEANEPLTDLVQREQQQSEAIQIFPSLPEKGRSQ